MKRILLLLLAFLIHVKMYGDVIIIDYSPVKICVKVENIGDYSDIVVVGLSNCLALFSKPKVTIVDSSSCIEVHKACPLTFYAVKKDYLEAKGIENINWKKDKNVRKSDITINARKTRVDYPNVEILEIKFFIAGFNKNSTVWYENNSMVMCETSWTYKFNDGEPDRFVDSLNPMDVPAIRQELLKLQKSF